MQFIPLRLSGAHGLRFRGIYRSQGKNVISLTGHVFTFARFRYFRRFLLRDWFRFRVLQCAQVFLFLFAFQFYLLLLRLRVFGVYPFWSGELFNQGRASAAERVEIDISHNALADGLLCADGQWRQIVTIEDALKGGCTLFDIEQLKRENSADDFKNLFMCEFVDDKASVFPFEELQRCMVDTLEEWEDYAPFAANPFGSRPVWIGYDPSHRGDSAGCVVLAPPVVAGGKFRILERHQWKGMDFATQAESIRKLTEKYNVEYIGIDATGLGVGVFQLVRSFYPAARDIRYTPEMKTAMVLKAKDVIRRGCLEYDVSATDITSSFMAIRKTMTSSGRSATYEASRSEEASHADLAWATMHALLNEPLTAGISTPLTSTILEFY